VLRSNLANDHAAVAAGDALRLFTSAFITTSVQQLGITLLCLFSVRLRGLSHALPWRALWLVERVFLWFGLWTPR